MRRGLFPLHQGSRYSRRSIGYDRAVDHMVLTWLVIVMVCVAAVALTVKHFLRIDRRQRYFIDLGTLSERWLAEQRGERAHIDH